MLRLTALVPQPIASILLLFGYRGFVKSFMHRSIKEATTGRTSEVFLILHDLAGTLRAQRRLLDFTGSSTILESFVHFGLP